jgi:dTDP-4-dehydrorhamnose 3,5-epimerase
MRLTRTAIAGVVVVDIEPHADERGMFARTYCAQELAAAGLHAHVAQINVSANRLAGTVRGLHWAEPQAGSPPETKVVRCTAGRLIDVVVDLRPGSPTYLEHVGVELTADNRLALYIPDLCAAGMQTLRDDSELLYQISEFYTPAAERGLHHADPALKVAWPLPIAVISDKDAAWPFLERREVPA